MTRTAEEILDLANKATRSTVRGHQGWSCDDWADMQQEAALAICLLGGDAHEGTCIIAAKQAIYLWMRIWLRTPRAGLLYDFLDYGATSERTWPLAYLDALAPLLEAQRAENAARDVAYLKLLLRGVSTAGIAMELDISERLVFSIRERLVPRLERIARGEAAPPWKVSLHDNSAAALERINSDPAALARRGDAIRAGCARRKQRLAERQSI